MVIPKHIPMLMGYLTVLDKQKKELEERRKTLEGLIEREKRSIEADTKDIEKKIREVEGMREDLERKEMECKLRATHDLYSKRVEDEVEAANADLQVLIRVMQHPEIEKRRVQYADEDHLKFYDLAHAKFWLDSNNVAY